MVAHTCNPKKREIGVQIQSLPELRNKRERELGISLSGGALAYQAEVQSRVPRGLCVLGGWGGRQMLSSTGQDSRFSGRENSESPSRHGPQTCHRSPFNPSPGFTADLVLTNERSRERKDFPHSPRSNQGALPRGCRRTHLRDADLQHGRLVSGARLLPEPKTLGPGHAAALARTEIQGRRVRGRRSRGAGQEATAGRAGRRPEGGRREATRSRKRCVAQSREGRGVSDATFPTWRPIIGAREGGPGKSRRPMAERMRRWGGEDGRCSPNPRLRC